MADHPGKLLDTLANWKPFRALVVGDFMLDRLTFGNADRLSNDAPVPILHVRSSEERPGGAANVALDLLAMRGTVEVFGVVGDDADGRLLRTLLAREGANPDGLVSDPARPTTVKQSLIGLAQHRHPQKMFRLDFESTQPLPEAVAEALLARVRARLAGADVVCLEDYNKGVCSAAVCRGVIDAARAAGVQVLVDPASISDYAKYRGCSAITPNRTEAIKSTGLALPDGASPEAFVPVAARLLEQLGLEAAVITLDKHGALLLEREGEARVLPTVARQVYDVTGAGDMVLAALAAARGNGLDWYDSVRFANAAAGLEVEEFGVVPIPLERIHADILGRESRTRGKLRSTEELAVEVAAQRAKGRKVVFTNGCFDVLHAGHVSLLRRAAECGDYLIVAVNDDESVRKLKGPDRPVYPIEDRAQLLGELECVSAVVVFGEDTPERVIRAVRPDVLVKGAQYAPETIPGAEFVRSYGGELRLLEVVEGRSTTRTLQKIRAG
jgi:D-beta-D-heptose 7-phosphate kinase/D-beta-D-heptose 1-phosphate adenosyltransferase